MKPQERFIEVAATDTVGQVMDKLTEYNKDKDSETYAIWLVVSEMPPWQFSAVKANKLYEVESADPRAVLAKSGWWYQAKGWPDLRPFRTWRWLMKF